MAKRIHSKKYIYAFGDGKADGNESMKNLLGGKGANLAEMAGHPKLKLPVPPGFTITTDVCNYFSLHKQHYPVGFTGQLTMAIKKLEQLTGKKYADFSHPLLLSIRSGARRSMPGMMETILNVGLNDDIVNGLMETTGDMHFAYEAYRRLIVMYADVVLEKAAGIDSLLNGYGKGVRKFLEDKLEQYREKLGYQDHRHYTLREHKELIKLFKNIIHKTLGQEFPDDPWQQLWGGIEAVFASWNGKRAVEYRRIENIPHEWGTAVNVQVMVYGNRGEDSCTGVAFTRNPATGDNQFYGEYLINAQGEDVVAGIRTPSPINRFSANAQSKNLVTLQKKMPALYKELNKYQQQLEKHYKDMQDIEFTIEQGVLYMLQCRTGKRTGQAAVQMAMDMYREKLIDAKTAVMRVSPDQIVSMLLPMLDPAGERASLVIAKGLPAGPGGASGRIVFTSSDAVQQVAAGAQVILVREETSPEDVQGMHLASAILTSKGGMTSHAALVARGWGKCCIVGCADIHINLKEKTLTTKEGKVFKAGDWLSLNGTKGLVYAGQLKTSFKSIEKNDSFNAFMKLTDRFSPIDVRANAETKKDAIQALRFGAKGIGLFRTEHIFFDAASEKPLLAMQQLICSNNQSERQRALNMLFPYFKKDIRQIFEIMEGYPVTIRLLDPPLHEFLPKDEEKIALLAKSAALSVSDIHHRIRSLHETNPMLGHRGVRLGITFPEITIMQLRAIFEAAAEMIRQQKKVYPEIMIPVTVTHQELEHQKKMVVDIHKEVCEKFKLKKIPFHYGTMIETPRAALCADQLASVSDFFSFGTNDLTQMTLGMSRDDIGSFLPAYLAQKICLTDPFAHIDQEGVGRLISMAVEKGSKRNARLELGVCGEHAGDPQSIDFFIRCGIDYMSCSPFRVPVARLSAAQSAMMKEGK